VFAGFSAINAGEKVFIVRNLNRIRLASPRGCPWIWRYKSLFLLYMQSFNNRKAALKMKNICITVAASLKYG
jgi:hypothetical protein